VRLEGADAAGELQVWYGNPTATTTSDGDATYEFFDHFDGTDLDSEKWDQTYIGSHTKSVSDSVFAHTATGAGVKVLLMKRDGSTVDFAGNYTVTARVKNSAVTTVNNRAGIVHKSSPNGYVAMVGGGTATANVPGIWGLNDGVGWGAKAKSVASGTWYTLSARHSGSSLYYREGSDSWTAAAWSGRSGATGLELSYASGVTASFDYVLVRAYSATPPAALTFSGERETLQPFPGCSNDPTDPDADGLYEDINGNARWDFQDITLFFQHLAWCEANQPVSLFDWNSNGRCDFDDVFRLWSNGGMI